MREILSEAARKGGVITVRRPMGQAGEQHQEHQWEVQRLVERGEAKWINPARTLARLTRDGWNRVD